MRHFLSTEAHQTLIQLIDSRVATHTRPGHIHHQAQESPLEQLLTADELGKLLNLHAKTVYDMAIRNEIPSFKIGSSRRFRISEVETWLVSQRT